MPSSHALALGSAALAQGKIRVGGDAFILGGGSSKLALGSAALALGGAAVALGEIRSGGAFILGAGFGAAFIFGLALTLPCGCTFHG